MQDPTYIMPLMENMACSYSESFHLGKGTLLISSLIKNHSVSLGEKHFVERTGAGHGRLLLNELCRRAPLYLGRKPHGALVSIHTGNTSLCQRAGCGATHLESQHLEDRGRRITSHPQLYVWFRANL